jgi:hypothetical protein
MWQYNHDFAWSMSNDHLEQKNKSENQTLKSETWQKCQNTASELRAVVLSKGCVGNPPTSIPPFHFQTLGVESKEKTRQEAIDFSVQKTFCS